MILLYCDVWHHDDDGGREKNGEAKDMKKEEGLETRGI